MDYRMSHADKFSKVDVSFGRVRSPSNGLGIERICWGGFGGSVFTVANAVPDALGISDIDMPTTLEVGSGGMKVRWPSGPLH